MIGFDLINFNAVVYACQVVSKNVATMSEKIDHSATFAPAPGVVWCIHDDAAVLLCTDTNRYHSLEQVGRVIWQRIAQNASIWAIAEELTACYPNASPAAIREDVERTIVQLVARGLVRRVAATKRASKTIRPLARTEYAERQLRQRSLLAIVFLLVAIRIALVSLGLRRVLAFMEKPREQGDRAAVSADLIEAARRIAFAAPLSPFRAECLERSLCLMWLCRRVGADLRLRIGVQLHPFSAHAWVDYRESPVNDHLEHIRTFIPLTQVSA